MINAFLFTLVLAGIGVIGVVAGWLVDKVVEELINEEEDK